MLACVDVDYQPAHVTAACVGFETWSDALARIEVVVRTPGPPAPYQPGAFFVRELPHLMAVLDRMPAIEIVIVDAYVWLGPDAPGLGKHLHDARGVPVIGVAKSSYAGAEAIEVKRGTSDKPLYVTAVGIEPREAAAHIAAMHGGYRVPTLIKRADQLARC